MPTPALNPLALYRHAVQHPMAEVRFFEKAYAHHNGPHADGDMLLLREDFCGTAAVASAFVASDPDRQAIGVDLDANTLAWANSAADAELGDRAQDLHLVESDVLTFFGPRVDCVCSLNFSTLIYHNRAALRRYFLHAKRCLNPGGVFIMDLFGGPGAMIPKTQSQTIEPDDLSLPAYSYRWEQRAFDPGTGRIDCRIHFQVDDQSIQDAFAYDWRLWSPADCLELLTDCGFAAPTLWTDKDDQPGHFSPDASLVGRDEFTCYLTAQKPSTPL